MNPKQDELSRTQEHRNDYTTTMITKERTIKEWTIKKNKNTETETKK